MKKRGGARPNSGRKPGSGKWGEPTTIVRVPVSMVKVVETFVEMLVHRNRLKALDLGAIRDWISSLRSADLV